MNPQRTNTLSLVFLFCFLVIVLRLGFWQLVRGQDFQELVLRQSYQPQRLEAEPGLIYSQDGFPLAQNQHFYSLSIYKPDLRTPLNQVLEQINTIAPQFTTNFQLQISRFQQNSKSKWQTFDIDLTLDQKKQLSLPGVSFQPRIKRSYPEGNESNYLVSLQRYYHKELWGRSGFSLDSKNAVGQTTLTKKNWFIPPKEGSNLYTTINREVQYISQEAIRRGVQLYSADTGSIIVLRPQDAAILAIANFTAPDASESSTELTSNISALFEPGSIFKPLVVAMALDQKAVNTDYVCSQCFQPRTIGQYTITNWDNLLHPDSSLKDIIKNSDNIGMSFIITQLGQPSFLSYFHALKLDYRTGIDLAGESQPPVKKYWPEIDLATASFGQGFATTQIGMISAFSVLANRGNFVQPYLVSSIEYQGNKHSAKHSTPKTIFRPDTTDQVIKILRYATQNGVVSRFNTRHLDVCGKSGTAQVAVEGHYTDSTTIASYVGFSPCDNPKFTMIVTINNPKTSPWGSSTAAPIWFEIAQRITPLL